MQEALWVVEWGHVESEVSTVKFMVSLNSKVSFVPMFMHVRCCVCARQPELASVCVFVTFADTVPHTYPSDSVWLIGC